jgi:hypothetical protein
MAYDNPGNPGEGMEEGMREEGEHQMGPLYVSPDMLPPGMKLKKGEVIEFRVMSDADQDGDWMIEYNTGKGQMNEHDSAWEDDLRSEMSPRMEQEEAS